MRRLLTITATAILGSALTIAQPPPDRSKSGMMNGKDMMAKGMTGGGRGMTDSGTGMRADPLRVSVFTSFALPEMQSELGLSAHQATQLRQMKQQMLAKGRDLARQIEAKQKDLDAAATAASPKNDDVKQLLEQLVKLRAEAQFTAFETAANMKAALTELQRTKLAAMKRADLHQAFMSHISMAEMSDVMRFMGADGAMTHRGMGDMMGMMGGGMSQGMMTHDMKKGMMSEDQAGENHSHEGAHEH